MKTLIYVKAKNDANGSPRRGWIVTWMDNLFINEGYEGRWALYKHAGQDGHVLSSGGERLDFDLSVNEITLMVTVGQYKALKRGAK